MRAKSLELGLLIQPRDADLAQAIQAKQASQNLLGQLVGKYPLAEDAMGEPSTGGHAGASGSGPSQPLAAPQDREASLADAFFDAIRDNDVAKVTDLLNQDSRLLEQTIARENGEGAMRERTPLMYAAQWGNQPMVSLLLEQGAQVDQVTKDGRTPLMIAAQEGHLEVAQYLVEKGAQVDQATKDGRTPLMIAAQEGHLEVTQYLVEQGAQVDQVTKDGRTPLMIAAQEGHLEVAQYLVEQGAQGIGSRGSAT